MTQKGEAGEGLRRKVENGISGKVLEGGPGKDGAHGKLARRLQAPR